MMNREVSIELWLYPKWIPYLMALLTICSGVFSSITSTWMNQQISPPCYGCEPEGFVGAMLQTQLMFIAETAAIMVWYIDHVTTSKSHKVPLLDFVKDETEYLSAKGRWWYWPVCAICDFGATLMVNHAYTFTHAATVEMLRNFMVVVAALLQIILIRKALVVHEWIGVCLITIAMILTAVPAILNPVEGLTHPVTTIETVYGVLLAVGGTTVQALQLLVEEFFFRKGTYPPLKAVGVEGITGIILTCLAWPVYQLTGGENVSASWYQLYANKTLLGIGIGYAPIGLMFNICGLGTTKLAGGLLRGICFAVRAPLVWILSMMVKWQGYDNYSFGGAIVFFVGFVMYCNCFGYEISGTGWLQRPVPCFCTDPRLNTRITTANNKDSVTLEDKSALESICELKEMNLVERKLLSKTHIN